MVLPPEVLSAGRDLAARAGIDQSDGISCAAEAWWRNDLHWDGRAWLVAKRDCIDQRRRESGQRGEDRRALVVLDDRPELAGAGCDDPALAGVDCRVDVVEAVRHLSDTDLAHLARVFWLGMPATGDRSATARALRHARQGPPPPPPPPRPPVSERELAVLRLLGDGLTREQVAARLHLAPETVASHSQRARKRIGARNTTHAVALMLRAGWIL